MMSNLFSIFEPGTSFTISLNWLSIVLIFMILPALKWASVSRVEVLFEQSLNNLSKEYKILMSMKSPWILFTLVAFFLFILINNFFGLFPYVFTASSHLVFTLSMSLPLWLGYTSFGFMMFMGPSLAHLTPQGTPKVLIPLMVVIESVSSLIRPVTLAIRLMANMIAGHLLLTLLSSSVLNVTVLISISLVFVQMLLLTLEFAVSGIQSYVFTTLSVLYISEMYYAKL